MLPAPHVEHAATELPAQATAEQARALTDRIKAGFAEVDRLRALRALLPKDPKPRDRRSVYFIQAESGHIKIGVAADVDARLTTLRTMSPVPLKVLGVIEGEGQAFEQELHARFASHRSHGEWFHAAPELLDFIQENA